jgi:ribosomal protein S27AE
MAILKYYKVDSDGTIKRLRRECPQPQCGAGTFLAWHADRQTCGKCGLTYSVRLTYLEEGVGHVEKSGVLVADTTFLPPPSFHFTSSSRREPPPLPHKGLVCASRVRPLLLCTLDGSVSMRNSNNFTPLIPVVPRESLHTRTSSKEATGSRAIDHAQASVDEAVGSSSLVHPKRAGQRYPAGTSTSSASVERKENTRLGASSAGHTGRSLATFVGKAKLGKISLSHSWVPLLCLSFPSSAHYTRRSCPLRLLKDQEGSMAYTTNETIAISSF